MNDNKTSASKFDRDRINVNEWYEVRDWCEKLGVSEETLRAAVSRVGVMADDVARELCK